MINPLTTSIAAGVGSVIVGDKIKDYTDDEKEETVLLRSIEHNTATTVQLLHQSVDSKSGTTDYFENVTISKVGVSSPITPNLHGKLYMRIFSKDGCTLNIASIIGSFNITIPAALWYRFDLPDIATYELDASYPNASTTVRMCYTDVLPA